MILNKEEVLSIFCLAGVDTFNMWELPNQYWPESYTKIRAENPWWLVKTNKGLIKIGWRKRVISIDWSDTGIAKIVTEEDVTKNNSMVHAWSYTKAIEYLRDLFNDERLCNTE